MTNVTVCNSQQTRKRVAKETTPPPKKRKTRKSGRGATCSWNCSFLHFQTGEGNGTPLQYSCLENPMDGGAW